jgi:hypothetical protein
MKLKKNIWYLKLRISNYHYRLLSFSSIDSTTDVTPPSKNNIQNEILIDSIIHLEFKIDLPGVENYGFEGESSFMKCKYGAVASDSEEASKVGRYFIDSHLFI